MAFKRNTRQRRAISDAFERAARPLSIPELVATVEDSAGPASVATVYRTVRALVDEGWLETIEVPGAGMYYEVAGKEHHHHFSCLKCRATFELPDCQTPAAKLPRGFQALSHEVTVFGLCKSCATTA